VPLSEGAMMSARYIPKMFSGKLHDPSTSEHDPIYALLMAGAFVAVADGRVDSAERARRSIT
jgi:hypothetical protein